MPVDADAGTGLITGWVRSIGSDEHRGLLHRIAAADVALREAIPSYATIRRVERAALLLLFECAARRGLSAGELASLLPDLGGDLLSALRALTGVEE